MKKILLAVFALFLLGGAVFAHHPKTTGIGVVLGGNFGDNGGGGDLGLSLKLPSIPIFWTARVSINSEYTALAVSGDKYFIDENLIKEKSFKLDWYVGLGAYGEFASSDGDTYIAAGGRLPIGLSYHFKKPFEVWLALNPYLGVGIMPDFYFPAWGIPAELGGRVWLK